MSLGQYIEANTWVCEASTTTTESMRKIKRLLVYHLIYADSCRFEEAIFTFQEKKLCLTYPHHNIFEAANDRKLLEPKGKRGPCMELNASLGDVGANQCLAVAREHNAIFLRFVNAGLSI